MLPSPIHALHLIETCFDNLQIEKLSRDTKFVQRTPRKILPLDILKTFCMMAFQAAPTLHMCAAILSMISHVTVSKQAVFKRVTTQMAAFYQHVLAAVLCQRATSRHAPWTNLFAHFGRVLVQDSTIVKLPENLSDSYPGSKNQTGKTNAAMRIQTILDVKTDVYLSFDLNPFTHNDQGAASGIVPMLRQGDLVLRDLGYFVIGAFRDIIRKGAFILSRYKYGTIVYSINGMVPLDIRALLKRRERLDMHIYLGAEERLPVRLIAIPVPQEVANKRRRELRSNRDKRLSPSRRHLDLLGWTILVTTVPESIWTSAMIMAAYGFRWRIEIIFKAWKSHCSFESIPAKASRYQVEALTIARLIFITLFHVNFWNPLRHHALVTTGAHMSILKLIRLIPLLSFGYHRGLDTSFTYQMIMKFAVYEKRKRKNYSLDSFETGWAIQK